MAAKLAPKHVRRYPQWYVDQAFNECYEQDLTLMHRDCDLTQDQLAQYRLGRILREAEPLSASYRVAGSPTTHRIALMSRLDGVTVDEVSHLESDPELRAQGRCAFPASSRFKVIDIYRRRGKTQILLLHLPQDERWRLFGGSRRSLERQVVAFARRSFDEALERAPLTELTAPSWRELCAKPVGFDEKGVPYDLETPLQERLRTLNELDFRAIVGSLFYVLPPRAASDAAGLAAFGYVDPAQGVCLEVLGAAQRGERGFTYARNSSPEPPLVLAKGASAWKAAQVVDDALFFFRRELEALKERVGEENLSLWGARAATYLDPFRERWQPDVVTALLFKESGLVTESVKLKTLWAENQMIFAELLDEPMGSFGSHRGDELVLAHGMLAGEPQCFAVPAFGPLHEHCAAEHGLSPVAEAKPMVIATDHCALALPDAYLEREPASDKAHRAEVFELDTDLTHGEVEVFELSRLGAFPHELTNSLIQSVRQRLTQGQGLIEINLGVTSGEREYYYALDKLYVEEEAGPLTVYHLLFCLNAGEWAAYVDGYFFDLSLGGLRQSVAFEDLVKELGSQEAAQAAWAQDPYDDSITEGSLKDHGDFCSYDKDFPAHALSEVRRLVKFMCKHDALATARSQHLWPWRQLRKSA